MLVIKHKHWMHLWKCKKKKSRSNETPVQRISFWKKLEFFFTLLSLMFSCFFFWRNGKVNWVHLFSVDLLNPPLWVIKGHVIWYCCHCKNKLRDLSIHINQTIHRTRRTIFKIFKFIKILSKQTRIYFISVLKIYLYYKDIHEIDVWKICAAHLGSCIILS